MHYRITKLVLPAIVVLLSASSPAPAVAPQAPPLAPVRDVVDTYHGTKVHDPYRYFEDFKNADVQAWVRGQAGYAQQALRSIPGRDRLLERVRQLDEGVPYRITVIRRWANGDLHYLKRMADENLEKLYFREAEAGGRERLLVDPERLARAEGKPETEHYSVSFVCPSPDARYVAYGLSASGSEQAVLRVLDVASGRDLPDVIDRMEYDYTWPSWQADSRGFVYGRRRDWPPGTPATELWKKTYAALHRLGTDPAEDPVVFAIDAPSAANGAVPMSEGDFPSVILTPGSKWAVGKIKHGDSNELTLYAAPAEKLGTAALRWVKVCDVADEVKEFAVRGDEIYLNSAAGAPRYKVVRTSLARPDFKSAAVVLPPGAAVVEGIAAAKDALYATLLEAGLNRVVRVPYEKSQPPKPQAIETPAGASSAEVVQADADVDGVLIGSRSWVRGGRTYAYDPASGKLTDTGLRPQGKFDEPQGLVAEEVLVESHDGVRVPLSIVRRSDLELDGNNPALVIGYGSYGMTMSVGFRPTSLAWLERGGVLAFAHVRGGGAYGKEWHHAGRMATKPNTWKDFIACCEYLVNKGYTKPQKLSGEGGSAGGILIGRAITERPDLFGAAVIDVGCLDMVRSETTTNGVPNIQEFGSVATKEGFDALLAMSAYHQVKDGVKYPAVLLTHGVNDPRVEAWMSAKMTARLQAASTSGKPVLFRVDYQAGHGIGSTKRQYQEETADSIAFLLWQLGDKEFQK